MGFADFIIRIGLNSSNFTAGKNKTVSDIQQIDVALHKLMNFDAASALAGTGIGALLFKGFQKANGEIDKLIEKADKLKAAATRNNLDTTTLQQMQNVARENNMDPDSLQERIDKVADPMQAIRDGTDTAAKYQMAFARLGVTLDDIKRKNHQQVFFEIAENIKSVEMTTERMAALRDIFGRNAGEMLPMFKEGFNSPVANRGVLSESEIKDLDELKKLNKEANAPWEAFGKDIALKFGRATTGLKALPSLIAGYFSPTDTGENASTRSMSQRLVESQTRKAEADARKAAEKKKKDDLEKKAKEIATRMAQEQERAQREEIQSARPSARRGILANRNRAIAARLENIDTQIRINGDPDGSLALERQRLLNDRSENRRGIDEVNRGIKGVSLLQEGVSDRQRVGLFTGRADNSERIFQQQLSTMQRQLTATEQAVRELQSLRQDINE